LRRRRRVRPGRALPVLALPVLAVLAGPPVLTLPVLTLSVLSVLTLLTGLPVPGRRRGALRRALAVARRLGCVSPAGRRLGLVGRAHRGLPGCRAVGSCRRVVSGRRRTGRVVTGGDAG